MSDGLEKTLTYINKCIEIGRFTPPNLSEIAETASIVEKGSIDKLKSLEEAIEKLVSKLTEHDYDELDVLMKKNLFYTDSIQKLLTITKFVQDTIFSATRPSIDLLSEVYEKSELRRDALQTISFMGIDGSNPMKVAMSADASKSLTTFEKWRDIVDGYLQHFLFVETFVKRLLFGDTNTDAVELEKLIKELQKRYPEWEDEFKPTPESSIVQAIVEHVQDMDVDNETRSDILIDYMRRTFPNDTFHVLVFNEPTQMGEYASAGKLTKYFRHGKCSVAIGQSSDYQMFTAEELRDIRREVRNVGAIDVSNTSFDEIPQKYMDKFDAMFGEKHGSFTVIRDTQKLAVRVAPVISGRAPGWAVKTSIRGSDGHLAAYSLIAVFK